MTTETLSGTRGRAWLDALNADPLPWLLEEDTPAVRHLAMRELLDQPDSDPEVVRAQEAAMRTGPIAAILAAQEPPGWWVKPGHGYSPKYTGTVWQLIFLDQLGADGSDARVRAGCDYVLAYTSTEAGGFGCSGINSEDRLPPPSSVIHCLNGNLLRALIGLGRLEDERVWRAIDWQARSITGEGFDRYFRSSTSGPGFACAANECQPCAWGAIKALLGLARVPVERREPYVQRAIDAAVEFLLSTDPSGALYPMGWGNTRPNNSWFKLGFPSGYVADVLQAVEALCEARHAKDERMRPPVAWLLHKQDAHGRWRNEYAYNGKTWVDFEKQGAQSKWVTLRALKVLKMALA